MQADTFLDATDEVQRFPIDILYNSLIRLLVLLRDAAKTPLPV
jgi:hypothetical protein